MYFATFCLVTQMIDKDGNATLVEQDGMMTDDFDRGAPKHPTTSLMMPRREKTVCQQLISAALGVQKWGCLIGIYAGSLIIIISVFEIESETANGCGGVLMGCPSYHRPK